MPNKQRPTITTSHVYTREKIVRKRHTITTSRVYTREEIVGMLEADMLNKVGPASELDLADESLADGGIKITVKVTKYVEEKNHA